jgi:hypothetical protein
LIELLKEVEELKLPLRKIRALVPRHRIGKEFGNLVGPYKRLLSKSRGMAQVYLLRSLTSK